MESLLYYAAKLFWFLMRPEQLCLVLLFFAWWLIRAGRRLGQHLLAGVILFFALLSVWPVGDYLLQPLEDRFQRAPLTTDIAGIIVLGGGEEAELSKARGTEEFNWAAERYMALLPLLQSYPQAKVLVSGASGNPLAQHISGAIVAERWLRDAGVKADIVFEHKARNTWENASNLQPWHYQDPRPWLLVTSAFHMPRAVGVFRKRGWNVVAYPVDYRSFPPGQSHINTNLSENLFTLSVGLREWVGLLAYHLTGRTSSWLPAP
ncbi:YdcF family protein [Pokkaliibacter plantistimulans]|uniref:YdcF family protein n=1 Tax=Pokkaliibacter plantistimulans TaxID=1635171 RepID=UPI000D74FECF|nr:YdcF family protein [Pokkaliibacter plantistimulans]